MLAGIKTGKKKTKQQPAASTAMLATQTESSTGSDTNADIAAQLRASLNRGAAGAPPPTNTASTTATIQLPTGSVMGHKDEADMTVAELLVHEKTKRNDLEVRNILKSRHSRKAVDSDDEEQMTLQTFQASKRQKQQRGGRPDYQEQMIAKSWWYIESRNFCSERLLVTGRYCTLVLAPHSHSLEPLSGRHFYLVPIQTASSWREVEDEAVWGERQQFLTALRTVFNNLVLCWETVLDTKHFYQARLDIVVVNEDQFYDAPLFFKSALDEQAEQWLKIQNLRTSIPKNFSYFYLDYGGKNHYLQVIENKTFPRDFAIDTIAAMLDVTPLKMRKQAVAGKSESDIVRDFQAHWKPVDFITSLSTTQAQK